MASCPDRSRNGSNRRNRPIPEHVRFDIDPGRRIEPHGTRHDRRGAGSPDHRTGARDVAPPPLAGESSRPGGADPGGPYRIARNPAARARRSIDAAGMAGGPRRAGTGPQGGCRRPHRVRIAAIPPGAGEKVADLSTGIGLLFAVCSMAGSVVLSIPVKSRPGATPPAAPTTASEEAGDGRVRVAWDPPRNSEVTGWQPRKRRGAERRDVDPRFRGQHGGAPIRGADGTRYPGREHRRTGYPCAPVQGKSRPPR